MLAVLRNWQQCVTGSILSDRLRESKTNKARSDASFDLDCDKFKIKYKVCFARAVAK
jgi:hypothetical protein